ncbi:hypothetical protein [Pseudomonas chlororaphis]|uniref:hypothetical protein n=1 Tax=Pseudomonas chlororaphis TaxID=587753 RepID=UPI0015DEEB87|nr:hypothetical protein [Pseudomonas chlororaphis]QLL11715.1 hypothetical protein H0I86_22175 [Pseudomonas chlororaphis subsp. aurantiaca]
MALGGKREGAGRPKGQRNKITADIKVIAQAFGEEAVNALVEIMRDGDAPHAARVAATKEILDRGYGKSKQELELAGPGGGPIQTVTADLRNLTDEQLEQLEHIAAAARPDVDQK